MGLINFRGTDMSAQKSTTNRFFSKESTMKQFKAKFKRLFEKNYTIKNGDFSRKATDSNEGKKFTQEDFSQISIAKTPQTFYDDIFSFFGLYKFDEAKLNLLFNCLEEVGVVDNMAIYIVITELLKYIFYQNMNSFLLPPGSFDLDDDAHAKVFKWYRSDYLPGVYRIPQLFTSHVRKEMGFNSGSSKEDAIKAIKVYVEYLEKCAYDITGKSFDGEFAEKIISNHFYTNLVTQMSLYQFSITSQLTRLDEYLSENNEYVSEHGGQKQSIKMLSR